MTFAEAAERWLPKALKLKNPKSELIRLRAIDHLAPISAKPLTAVVPADLAEILRARKPETAIRVYSVAKAVFEFGAALLEPEGVVLRLPTDLMRLRALGWSPRSRKSHKPMPALNWSRAPELLAELSAHDESIARLFTFVLATVSRSGSARLAKRKHIDFKARTWTIPVEDLKDSRHRHKALVIPLSDLALSAIPPGSNDFVFANDHGKSFGDRDITYFTRKLRRRHPDLRPNDLSPCMARDRCFVRGRRRAANREVVEIAMGHQPYDLVESVYQRDDLLGPRAELMQRWDRHCRGETADVIPLRRA
jgi:integrase